MGIVLDYSTAWRLYLLLTVGSSSLPPESVLCIDYLLMSGGRNHSSTRSSQTFIPLKYCSTSRNSCKYKMHVIFRTWERAPDTSPQEQPLSASFEKIYQFVGWYDQWIDLHGNILRQRDQDAFHAVHSLIWSIAGRCIRFQLNSGVESFLGCGQLSTLEEQLVIVFTEMRGDDNNRLTVTINQAYKVQSFSSFEAISIFLSGRIEGSKR